MEFRRFLTGVLIFFGGTLLYASDKATVDTVLTIEEVVVKGNRLKDFAVGSSVQTIDSGTLIRHSTQSLAELLGSETAVSLKSYGPGGVASISLRGGGTRHTAVLWNGLNLQSPMNSSFNFSTIPVNFLDGVCIQYGGAGTLFGSGATTGTIHINNSLNFNDGLTLEEGSSFGNFNTYNQVAKAVFSKKNLATAIRFSYRSSENDFTFRNYEKMGHPMDTLKNAAFNGISFLQQNAVRLGGNSVIRTDFWVQNYYKEVPSLISDMNPGDDTQNDRNMRVAVSTSHYFSRLNLNTRFGILHEQLLFNDSENESLSVINEVEGKYVITEGHKVNLGINSTLETARAEGYNDNPSRKRCAIFGSYNVNYLWERVSSVLNFRQELVDGEFIPLVYSIATKVTCFKWLAFKSNISKNYALPTFNDLYWRKSAGVEGNPYLKPESGFSLEAGLLAQHSAGWFDISCEVSAYRSEIKNWIIWLPNSEGIWKPGNFEKGLSKGFESNSAFRAHLAQFYIKLSGMYALTYAKPIQTGEENDSYDGKQMIYVPRNKISENITLGWKTFNLSYSNCYIGQRYTDSDRMLEGFQVADASVSYEFSRNTYAINVFIKADNIWNTNYQLTKGYAMPGRSFTAGLNIKFHSK